MNKSILQLNKPKLKFRMKNLHMERTSLANPTGYAGRLAPEGVVAKTKAMRINQLVTAN